MSGWRELHVLLAQHDAAEGHLDDISEQMASKIINVFSDPVFFSVTNLQDWNLPEVVKHGMMRSGGKFYSPVRKSVTLPAIVTLVF